MKYNILFNDSSKAISPNEIRGKIDSFRYNDNVEKIIKDSKYLDKNGKVFINCAARVMSNFKMTRSGPFKGLKISKDGTINGKEILLKCWNEVGNRIFKIHSSVIESGYSRDRYLLELSKTNREELIAEIWLITKKLLPFTMGKTSYGLVGASKLLFSVLPEIVLPVDNEQWVDVFKTVDLGDIIKRMVSEIQQWETVIGQQLNDLDPLKRLTTLPSVYNVMAMAART